MSKKYLWQHPRSRLWYVRRKGQYESISGEPGTPEFDASYWAILNGTPSKSRTAKTTIGATIRSYRGSDRFKSLKPRTQADYQKVLDFIDEKAGARDIRQLQRRHVIEAMNAQSHRTRFANYIAQIFGVLCEHAIDIGWIDSNPAQGVRLLKTPEDRKKPHIVWPDWAVDRWRAEAREWHRLVFEIGVGTVQRPSDWLTLKWSDFDGSAIHVTQGKTGRALHIPCTETLITALSRAPKNGIYIITKSTGQPITYNALARRMYDERKRLGLLDYDLHALRYRGVQELALAGCTDEEIGSYSGHTSKAMITKYAGQARQRMRAQQAKEKRR